MYDEERELIATLRAMPVTLAALVGGVDGAGPAPWEPDWTVGEVVCHLLDGEQRTDERVLRSR